MRGSRKTIRSDEGLSMEALEENWGGGFVKRLSEETKAETVDLVIPLAEYYFDRFPDGEIVLHDAGHCLIEFRLPVVKVYAHEGTEYSFDDVYMTMQPTGDRKGLAHLLTGGLGHPHSTSRDIGINTFCTGYNPRYMFLDGRWHEMIDHAIVSANTYDSHSAYRALPEDVRECDSCGMMVVAEYGDGNELTFVVECVSCESMSCKDCLRRCDACDSPSCSNCSYEGRFCSEECFLENCYFCGRGEDSRAGGSFTSIKVPKITMTTGSLVEHPSAGNVHERCMNPSNSQGCVSCDELTVKNSWSPVLMFSGGRRSDYAPLCSECESPELFEVNDNKYVRCHQCTGSSSRTVYHPREDCFYLAGNAVCFHRSFRALRSPMDYMIAVEENDNIRLADTLPEVLFRLTSTQTLIADNGIRTCIHCGTSRMVEDTPEEIENHSWFCTISCGMSLLYNLYHDRSPECLALLREYQDRELPLFGGSDSTLRVKIDGNVSASPTRIQEPEEVTRISVYRAYDGEYAIRDSISLNIERMFGIETLREEATEHETVLQG